MAAGPTSPANNPPRPPAMQMWRPYPVLAADAFARDTMVAWFRGEFAAANAIIDALCGHLAELGGRAGWSEYGPVFSAIHRRRMNWIPVLQMQEFCSIADVEAELNRVAARRAVVAAEEGSVEVEGEGRSESVGAEEVEQSGRLEGEKEAISEKARESDGTGGNGDFETVDDSPATGSDANDSGSQELPPTPAKLEICFDHQDCGRRLTRIKLTKGFKAKEAVEGHMVNVVKGLKLYEDIFTASELCRLNDFVDELRAAGRNGELPGETFLLFNEQIKENRTELIQFGLPSFKHIEEDTTDSARSKIMPIPVLLQDVIDHLVQWQLLPVYKKPNGCIINFFDKGERSRPFLKPPHLDHPVSTLFLSESRVAFGRSLMSDHEGSYKGRLMLLLREGSLLVMRGNSAGVARHAMCPSPNRRVAITFFRIRPDSNQDQIKSSTGDMALWQPGMRSPFAASNAGLCGADAADIIPSLGILRGPAVMLPPMHPLLLSPKKIQPGGTGVFLPWPVKSRKPARYLPPRARKGRVLDLPSPVETHEADCTASLGDTGTQTGVSLGNGHL
ncbi:RNA demethylase ALKBH10B-like [Rhodamnia argentea]|uniref:RNA demethylase ALKBH10B-like n=1 Tax=Rhodamnia argentea TaxID=178133 RepID=A0A8B8PCY6_9MYRT|nr:RNA demethylase ALKBH10B-like [Rhodamnia argentea]